MTRSERLSSAHVASGSAQKGPDGSGSDQKGVGWHHAKSGTIRHAPLDRYIPHLRPIAFNAGSQLTRIASIVSRTSASIASDTKTGCAFTLRYTTAADEPVMSASANARSHVSSNPALSTTMLTSRRCPPGCARNADTAFVSSARRYASPDESASDNAFAARSPSDADPPSFPPSSGQMLRSMRLPHSDTIRNSRSVSAMDAPLSLFEADAILAANAFAFLASDAAAPIPASSPARLSCANGSWPCSGDAGSKYPIAARILR